MSEKEVMDPEHLMIAVIVVKESTVSNNSDPITTRDSPNKKRQSIDHMEVCFVQDVSSLKSLEPFCWRKSKQSKEPRELPRNDPDLSLFKSLS